jgi:hypothetical protein
LQFKDIDTLKKYLVNQKGSQAARSQIIQLAARGQSKRAPGSRNGKRGNIKGFTDQSNMIHSSVGNLGNDFQRQRMRKTAIWANSQVITANLAPRQSGTAAGPKRPTVKATRMANEEIIRVSSLVSSPPALNLPSNIAGYRGAR